MTTRTTLIRAIAAVGLLLLPFVTFDQAHAAPAPAPFTCEPGLVPQADMMGTYRSDRHRMSLVIYPCGGLYLRWSNQYGTFDAVYETIKHLPDGVVARMVSEDNGYGGLDGEYVVGVKAGAPGYIEVFTLPGDEIRWYTLQKVSNRY